MILPGASRIEASRSSSGSARERRRSLPIADGPRVTIRVGVACYPDDGADKDELVGRGRPGAVPRQAGVARSTRPRPLAATSIVAALDETAIGLLNGTTPDELLETIISPGGAPARHAARLHLPRRARRRRTLVVRARDRPVHGLPRLSGCRSRRASSGKVCREGRPVAVDDYDAFEDRSTDFAEPGLRRGRRRAADRPAGGSSACIGLGVRARRERTFGQPRDRGAQPVRPARLDRPRERPPASRRPSAAPCTTRSPACRTASLLTERVVDSLVVRAAASSATRSPLILLDLDRFKVDQREPRPRRRRRVLREVGERLQRCLRPGDTVARFGGDTFGVLLAGIGGVDDAATAVAERDPRSSSSAPFALDGRDVVHQREHGRRDGAGPGSAGAGDVLQEAEIALVRREARRRARASSCSSPLSSRHASSGSTSRASCGRRSSATSCGPLPADPRPAHRADRRLRGARPLAAPDARPRPAASTSSPLAEETGLIVADRRG